jgi:Negative regulator of beta-lactamase expression
MFTIDSKTWRSPNHDRRHSAPISAIVVHSCEGALPSPRRSSLPWLCNPASRVSSHYYVCRDGTIYQLVDDENEAWHAGACMLAFVNARSLGVECEHRTGQDWPPTQKQALKWLIKRLIATHHIDPLRIETHGQIALPGPYRRKVDPSDWPHTDFDAFVGSMFTDAPPVPAPHPPASPLHRYVVKSSCTGGASIRAFPRVNAAILGRLHAGDSFTGEEIEASTSTYVKDFGSSKVWVRSLDQRCVFSLLLERVKES